MTAFILVLLFAGGPSAGGGGFSDFWNTYLNYPGFEAWKFINLTIFVSLLVYILKKPLSASFKEKREQIRAELIQAEAEKQAALAKLTETEAKYARLDSEKEAVLMRAEEEYKAEAKRIAEETEREIKKIREQAENEIARTGAQSKHKLRKLSADETIRLAEEMIKSRIAGKNDENLVKTGIESIGGAK